MNGETCPPVARGGARLQVAARPGAQGGLPVGLAGRGVEGRELAFMLQQNDSRGESGMIWNRDIDIVPGGSVAGRSSLAYKTAEVLFARLLPPQNPAGPVALIKAGPGPAVGHRVEERTQGGVGCRARGMDGVGGDLHQSVDSRLPLRGDRSAGVRREKLSQSALVEREGDRIGDGEVRLQGPDKSPGFLPHREPGDSPGARLQEAPAPVAGSRPVSTEYPVADLFLQDLRGEPGIGKISQDPMPQQGPGSICENGLGIVGIGAPQALYDAVTSLSQPLSPLGRQQEPVASQGVSHSKRYPRIVRYDQVDGGLLQESDPGFESFGDTLPVALGGSLPKLLPENLEVLGGRRKEPRGFLLLGPGWNAWNERGHGGAKRKDCFTECSHGLLERGSFAA